MYRYALREENGEGFLMNPDEKKQMLAAIRAVEHFFFENAALQVVLTSRRVPDWKAQVHRLIADESVGTEMRVKFQRLYEQIEQSPDESKLIEAFLRVL